MNQALTKTDNANLLKKIIVQGDLSKLSEAELYEYNLALCELHGLNPLTQPFNYLKLKDGRVVAYANKACTDQLRQSHKASAEITDVRFDADLVIVFSKTSTPDGRVTHQIGAVSGRGSAEERANAVMKAVTKAFRRGMLTHCGLSVLDETERETMPGAVEIALPAPSQIEAPKGEKEW